VSITSKEQHFILLNTVVHRNRFSILYYLNNLFVFMGSLSYDRIKHYDDRKTIYFIPLDALDL